MLSEIFAIVAPVIFCAAIGYIWVYSGTDYPADFVTRIVMNIGAPCLILSSLSQLDMDVAALSDMILASGLLMLSMLVLGSVLIRVLQLSLPTYLPPLLFANSGNMGLPLCLFAFGEQGLALALGMFMAGFTVHMSFGIWLVSAGKMQLVSLIKQPVIHASILSTVLVIYNISLPDWVVNTTGLVGGLAIPLMLITLGVSLANLKVSAWRRSLLFSATRLLLGFALGLWVVWVLELEGVARGVVLMQSAMPVAVFNYLLALRYQRQPSEVAGMVVLSTLLSFIVLPLLVSFVLH